MTQLAMAIQLRKDRIKKTATALAGNPTSLNFEVAAYVCARDVLWLLAELERAEKEIADHEARYDDIMTYEHWRGD